MADERSPLLERLDFVYMPSDDVAADVERFTRDLGARLVFAIERFATRVAMLEPAGAGPAILFAEHLHGEGPILVYRVADLDATVEGLRRRGWDPGPRSEIPFGPLHSFTAPGGHRLAIYERTRPDRGEEIRGRRDF